MANYTLYFVDADGSRTKIESGLDTMTKIFDCVGKDKDERIKDFVSFYTRVNGVIGDDEELWIDFGSHSKFYVAVKEK